MSCGKCQNRGSISLMLVALGWFHPGSGMLWIVYMVGTWQSWSYEQPPHLYGTPSLNSLRPGDTYMCQWTRPSLLQIMACHLISAKPLSETMLGILSNGPLGTNISETPIKIWRFSFTKMHLIMSSAKWWPFCLGLTVLMCDPPCCTEAHGSFVVMVTRDAGARGYQL